MASTVNGRNERVSRAVRKTLFNCGHPSQKRTASICRLGHRINLSHVFAGHSVGVTQVGDHVWPVTFMHCDLGYFDDEAGRVEPIADPFGSKVLPMCSE